MSRSLSLLGYVTVVLAQFNIKHTQYDTSPPVYPSPQISGAGGWDAALEKAQAFLAELTLEEKARMVTGTTSSSHRIISLQISCPKPRRSTRLIADFRRLHGTLRG